MKDLIEAITRATEGSRELDSQIRLHVIARELQSGRDGADVRKEMGYWNEGRADTNIPHYTTSLDAALTLVPEGMLWRVGHAGDERPGIFQAIIMPERRAPISAESRTPALALCIAALRARQGGV